MKGERTLSLDQETRTPRDNRVLQKGTRTLPFSPRVPLSSWSPDLLRDDSVLAPFDPGYLLSSCVLLISCEETAHSPLSTQSARSAVSGVTRVARRAGSQVATSAASDRNTGAVAKTTGSSGLTS